jgi:hypothetical protein
MLENLFVLSVLLLSGGYIVRRLQRMSQRAPASSSGSVQSACGSCASATCQTPAAATQSEGETPLRLHPHA